MTDQLYRQEALDHQASRLYGEVILTSSKRLWVITFLLLGLSGLTLWLIFGAEVQTQAGSEKIINWLMKRLG